MIALLEPDCTLIQRANVLDQIAATGLRPQFERIGDHDQIAIPGARPELGEELARMPGVRSVAPQEVPHALVARATSGPRSGSEVRVSGVTFGGRRVPIIAGPCAVEDEAQIHRAARDVAASGAALLRGGAFKPRTSPYSFQGLGVEGLRLLEEAGRQQGIPVVTEVVSAEDVDVVARHADVLQIGSRNMQNFALLRAAGQCDRPVLLKRGLMSTISETLLAAEYLLAAGNPDVLICERGIRSFDPATRNTFDVAAIPLLKQETHLPILADPSHAAGRRDLVPSLALAAVAAGADGILVEVHPDPTRALSDGPQSLTPDGFDAMMTALGPVAKAVGRSL